MKSLDLAAQAVERGAAQQVDELAELVAFLQARPAPASVLEIGVYRGGTLWLWRQLARPDGFVLGIEITAPACDFCERRRAHVDCPLQQLHRNVVDDAGAPVELLLADSHEQATFELARKRFPAGVDFLHVDGDHELVGASRDFELYAPLVKADGVLAIHDVAAVDGGLDVPGGRTLAPDEYGPALLWQKLRGANGATTIAHANGYGYGVLDRREWEA